MKHSNLKLTTILFVTVFSCLTLFTIPINAQIGNLGIYGSAPEAVRQDVFYARLELDLPPQYGCESCAYDLPLNGRKNFNFWYGQDGTAFLTGGKYKVSYWNANLTTRYGNYDFVEYWPNGGNTNGVEVRPYNTVTSTRGIYGTVLGYDRNGFIVPLPKLSVTAMPSWDAPSTSVRTNGDGFFSIYYQHRRFLASGSKLSGILCFANYRFSWKM